MKIEEEIDQKTFADEFVKAHINLMYTAGWAQLQIVKTLKPFNISVQQFNIMRILRGRSPRPASIRELTDRMLDKASNASRLVDKLNAKGLVVKQTSPDDNRRLEVVLTEEGQKLLARASSRVEHSLNEIYQNISEKDACLLNGLLDKMRG